MRAVNYRTTWAMQVVLGCGLYGAAQVAAHAQESVVGSVVVEPKKDDPQTLLAHSAGSLRAAFPSLSELEQGGVRMKPESYKGLSVESQPLRVLRNDGPDVGTIILGHDDLGATRLHWGLEPGKDGKVKLKSLAGVPGTEWILPSSEFVSAGDVRVRGLRLRVGVGEYEWSNLATGERETIDKVVRIEAEDLDDARPGELLYSSEGKEGARFVLSEKRGFFIVTNYASDAAHLIEARGWRKHVDESRGDQPTPRTGPMPPG